MGEEGRKKENGREKSESERENFCPCLSICLSVCLATTLGATWEGKPLKTRSKTTRRATKQLSGNNSRRQLSSDNSRATALGRQLFLWIDARTRLKNLVKITQLYLFFVFEVSVTKKTEGEQVSFADI